MRNAKIYFQAFLAIAIFFISASCLSAADYRVGGKWLTEGEGYAKKGILRVQLKDSGWLRFDSVMSGDHELLTGYEMYGRLEASVFEIGAWEDTAKDTYDIPIPLPPDFNPSMSDPFLFPEITMDGLIYTLKLTSASSGTLSVRGYVDIDGVGTCEVDATNDIWKEGTPRPESKATDSSSGCSAAAGGVFGLFSVLAAVIFQTRRAKK